MRAGIPVREWDPLLGSLVAGLVQSLFQQTSWLEVGLTTGRNVDNLARSWISGSRLRPGILDLKHPETSNFYAIALNQAIAHGDEKAVDHLRRQVLFTPGALANEEGEILLRYGRQEQLSDRPKIDISYCG